MEIAGFQSDVRDYKTWALDILCWKQYDICLFTMNDFDVHWVRWDQCYVWFWSGFYLQLKFFVYGVNILITIYAICNEGSGKLFSFYKNVSGIFTFTLFYFWFLICLSIDSSLALLNVTRWVQSMAAQDHQPMWMLLINWAKKKIAVKKLNEMDMIVKYNWLINRSI